MIPHLIHVGVPKTGSTYLQHWFEAHPQLAYRPGGIAGFADVHELASAAATPQPEARWRVTSNEELTAPRRDGGAIAVDYGREDRLSIADEQVRACSILAGLFPGATILLVTRGFRSAVLSGYSQYVRTCGSETFEEVLSPPVRDYPWNYDLLVNAYRRAFGAEKVIVLPFELLKVDSARFLGELEKRLGLDHHPFASPPVNVAASPVELAWYPRLTQVVRGLPIARSRAEQLYARLLYTRRLARLARLCQRIAPRQPVTADRIDDAFLDQFKGMAEVLRDDPLYEPFRAAYLL